MNKQEFHDMYCISEEMAERLYRMVEYERQQAIAEHEAAQCRMVIKKGWENAGLELTVIANPVSVNGLSWTPVLFDNEDDPSWFKSDGLELPAPFKGKEDEKCKCEHSTWNRDAGCFVCDDCNKRI